MFLTERVGKRMKQKTTDFRQQIADMFVEALEADPLTWRKGWNTDAASVPQNAVTKKEYKGINFLKLLMISQKKGYSDRRFATFNQITQNGWHLKKGSKGILIEYWFPWNTKLKHKATWEEFNADKENKIVLRTTYFHVFSAHDIEGIPPLPETEKKTNEVADLVQKISKSMGVRLVHEGFRPRYNIAEDKIYLPSPEEFVSSYEYNTTALHEEAHATGAACRLNRELRGADDDENYAREELVAEITAAFMAQHIQAEVSSVVLTEEDMNNHIAYVQSWIRDIKEKPDALIKAIRDAEQAADLLEYHGGLITEAEQKRARESTMEVENDIIVQSARNEGKDEKQEAYSIQKFLENIKAGPVTEQEALAFINAHEWEIKPPVHDPLGNVLLSQTVVAVEGEWKAELGFFNDFDPRIINLQRGAKVKTEIALWVSPVDPTDIERTINSKKISLWRQASSSLNRGQKNYLSMQNKWKEITGQEYITFAKITPPIQTRGEILP